MGHRNIASLIAGSVLSLGLGSCTFDALMVGDSGPAPTFSIGGTVTGATGPMVLLNSNGTSLIVAEEGAFTFGTPMVSTALYNVTVAVAPNSQACKVTNGAGIVGGADISNVMVICAPITYTMGRR